MTVWGESSVFILPIKKNKGHFVDVLYMIYILHYTAGATEEGSLQKSQKVGPGYRVCSSK